MIVASRARPAAGCLKAALRQARLQREQQQQQSLQSLQSLGPLGQQLRTQVTAAFAAARRRPPSPASIIHHSTIPDLYTYKRHRLCFAVHPAVPSIRATAPDPLPGFTAAEIQRLDPTGARANLVSRTRPDAAREGDILLVTPKNGESFAGVLMQIRRRGTDTAVQLRGQALGTGVEMWYKIFSPQIVGIDIVWRRPKRARRARLTYMRKPKHDMGDVTKYVIDWRREQRQLRTKVRSKGDKAAKKF